MIIRLADGTVVTIAWYTIVLFCLIALVLEAAIFGPLYMTTKRYYKMVVEELEFIKTGNTANGKERLRIAQGLWTIINIYIYAFALGASIPLAHSESDWCKFLAIVLFVGLFLKLLCDLDNREPKTPPLWPAKTKPDSYPYSR